MVNKSGRFDIRSGNSLKSPRSREAKRNYGQACIVRHTEHGSSPPLAGTMLTELDVGENNVVYSLNKKGRWQLPDLLKDHLHSAEVQEEEIKITLLEHHKLKRQANCVSYHSSKGEVTSAKHGKGYFSESSIRNKSKRSKKSRQKSPVIGIEDSWSDPEVCFEVYYPSPKSSSVSHCLKYMGDPNTGGVTNLKYGQKKKVTNKRFNLSTSQYLNTYVFDGNEIDCDEDEQHSDITEELSTISDNSLYTQQADHFSFEDVFEEALRKKDLKMEKISGDKIARNKITSQGENAENKYGKGNIVHLDEWLPRSCSRKLGKPRRRGGRRHRTRSVKRKAAQPVVPARETTVLPSVTIVLPADNVYRLSLSSQYGERYVEAGCQPRKFGIDISSDIAEVLRCKHMGLGKQELWTWLIFTARGSPDLILQTFSVQLNIEVDIQDCFTDTLTEFNVYSLKEICQKAAVFVENCFREKKFEIPYVPSVTTPHPALTFDTLRSFKNWDSEMYHASQSHKLSMTFNVQGNTAIVKSKKELVCPSQNSAEFCQICFDTVGPDSGNSATALRPCRHQFCDLCWIDYLKEKIRSGSLRFTCPEFNCSSQVDHMTVLSLISATLYKTVLHRIHDNYILQRKEEMKWCPNPKCGRIIISKVPHKGDDGMCVTCDCGMNLCFKCLGEAHWPANCQQAEKYTKKIQELGDDKDSVLLDRVTVKVKYCPYCHEAIEKNGGCPQVYCVCGNYFCWLCEKPWHCNGDYCEFWSGGWDDFSRTKTKILRAERKTLTADSTRSSLYIMALGHRQRRTKRKVKELINHGRVLTVHLKSCHKKQSSCIKTSNEVTEQTVDMFISNVINLLTELHFMTEYIMVVFQFGRDQSGGSLQDVTLRMEFICSRMEQILQDGSSQDLHTVVPRLQQLQTEARTCVRKIIRLFAHYPNTGDQLKVDC